MSLYSNRKNLRWMFHVANMVGGSVNLGELWKLSRRRRNWNFNLSQEWEWREFLKYIVRFYQYNYTVFLDESNLSNSYHICDLTWTDPFQWFRRRRLHKQRILVNHTSKQNIFQELFFIPSSLSFNSTQLEIIELVRTDNHIYKDLVHIPL